jgi:penicillin-binding protein 1A
MRRAHLLSAVSAVALALVTSACAVSLPHIPNTEPIFPRLAETSALYDAQGRFITTLHAAEDRTVVPLNKIPKLVQDAVIATEDQRFWDHRGVDLKAILRATYQNVREGRIAQGGSTITEQLAKNTITGDDRTIARKVKDAVLALELEQRYTKEQILDMYLNTVYFGQGAYGIQAAAKTYFSVPATQLTLPEAALLAGLIASPAAFDPVFHPDLAQARRDLVLGRMRTLGMIDGGAYRSAVGTELTLDPFQEGRYPAPYFVDYVKQWFLGNPDFGATYEQRYNLLFAGGLRIYTTVDLTLQKYAEDAVNSILSYQADPYGAMTVIDPRTGAIRAMVGGRDYFGKSKIAKLNLATGGATGRQAGSAFKPFALVSALTRGISPLAIYAAPSHLNVALPRGYSPPVWPVTNYDGEGGGSMTLEQATIHSVNTVYAQLIMQVGPANVTSIAHTMGITSPLRAYPSAVLGANEVNTLEMASAYGSLATLGKHTPPMAVSKITDTAGRTVYEAEPQLSQVINSGVAWTTTQILQKVVQEGTGTQANLGRPVAGKTGTAQQWTNAWFVGYLPQLVAAVWVGFPQGQIPMAFPRVRLPHVLGGTWPTEIWHAFMVKATRNLPVQNWTKPFFRFVSVAVDTGRGCLPTRWTLPTSIAVFTYYAGTEPTARCAQPSGPQLISVPSVVGLPQAAAERTLQSYAYDVDVVSQESATAPPGTVLSQNPPGGVGAFQGTRVTITVASAPPPAPKQVAVPNVVGLQQSDAVLQLSALGFQVVVTSKWACTPPASCGAVAGEVWLQSPPSGALADSGSVITIWANPTP